DEDPPAPAPAPAPLKLAELEPLTRENLKRIEELRSEPVGSMTASWRPDGKELLLPLSSSGQEGVEIRDAETLEVLGTTAPGRRVIQIFFNPRLPQVLLVTVNSGVEMVNTETGDGFVFDDLGRGAATLGVSYRPDGKQVAIGGQQGKLFLVDTATGEKQHVLELEKNMFVMNPAYSRDGKLIAVNPARGAVRIWESDTGRLVRELEQPESNTGRMCLFDRSGERLLTLETGKNVAFWKIADGSNLWKREPEENPPLALRWVAEGTVLVGVAAGAIVFYDPAELQALHELESHTRAFAFGISPDGKRLMMIGRNDGDPSNLLTFWGVPKAAPVVPAEAPPPAPKAAPAN
ncbi:MAG: WD40 repeat domain-containing protein, partial [Planctomycetaceae bacterium]